MHTTMKAKESLSRFDNDCSVIFDLDPDYHCSAFIFQSFPPQFSEWCN